MLRIRTKRTLLASLAALALVLGLGAVAEAGPRERRITDALIWTGVSERVARSRLDRSDRSAVAEFERRAGMRPDGRLAPHEEAALLDLARVRREREGYRTQIDTRTGVRLGLPTAWLGRARETGEGTQWRSPDGAIDIETFRTTRDLANIRARESSRGRVTYRTGGRDWFVVSGYNAGRPFYARAEQRNGEVRGVRIDYDPTLRRRLDRVVVAMSSDLRPFAAMPEPRRPRFAALPDRGPLALNRPRPESVSEAPRLASLETTPAPLSERDVLAERELGTAAGETGTDPIPLLAEEFGPTLPPAPNTDAAPKPTRRAGLEPLSGAPVPATGEETEAGVPAEITGMLTDEGQSCPTLRAANGALYALVGEVPSVEPGTVVTIEAVEVETERCSAGRTVAVGAFRVRQFR